MIVCKRDVLRLPPAAQSGAVLLKSIKGLTHVMFNHRDPNNSQLAKNFAEITAMTETLAIQDGGVIIRIKSPVNEAGEKPAPATSTTRKGTEKPGPDLPSDNSDVPQPGTAAGTQ